MSNPEDFLNMPLYKSKFMPDLINVNAKPCQNECHLDWKILVQKYGEEEVDKIYKPYCSCPTCGEKRIYGD